MAQMKEEMDNVQQNMDNLSRKYGEQLVVLAEDISQVGKNFVGEQNKAQFEYRKPDPGRPNEGYAASRALLAKAKHYAVGGGRKHRELEEELRRLRNDREEREAAQMEKLMMLSQAKQNMDAMKETMQDLKDDNARLQQSIQNRNAQIAAMGKAGGDEIDDPDLKMLNDEHQGQIGKIRTQLQEETRKAERANRERDEVLQQVERMKAEVQAQKERFAKEKADIEAQHSVLLGYNNDMKEFEKNPQNSLTPPSAPIGEHEKSLSPTAQKHIKSLEGELQQSNDEKKRLEEENQQLKTQIKNLGAEVSVAKQSAAMSDSKFRKATEEHLKERDSLRASLDKASATRASKTLGSIKKTVSKGSLKLTQPETFDESSADEDNAATDFNLGSKLSGSAAKKSSDTTKKSSEL